VAVTPERHRRQPGLQSTSRFGIRGTEDLGGGLKAVQLRSWHAG
jgi:predicted porin